MFNPIKRNWNDAVHAFLSQNPRKVVTKYNFLALLKKAWDKTMTASNICAWFRSSRIYPFSREKVQPVVLNISEEDENVSKYWYILCYICKSNVNVINNKFNVGTESNRDTGTNGQNEDQFGFDESCVRWLKLYHPDDIKRTGCKDWKLQKKLDE